MEHQAVKSFVRHALTYAPLILPGVMAVVTQRAFARAHRIKDLAINEVIPFADYAAAELRAKRLAFATFVLAIVGTIGLASLIAPPAPIIPKSSNHDDLGDMTVTPVMSAREPIPSHANDTAAAVKDDGE